MRDAVLVVVDIQNDFLSGGALAVPDAEAVLPVVNGLMRDFQRVILTQDWHPASHVSFASRHPGHAIYSRITLPYGEQVLWPDHCVEGTHGAAFHPAFAERRQPQGRNAPSAVTSWRSTAHLESR